MEETPKLCGACGLSVERSGWSRSQWERRSWRRRCLECVQDGKPLAATIKKVTAETLGDEAAGLVF